MNQRLQPGLHLDADTLNAFAEGALPAPERAQALVHLADCAHCRQIVFLTQQAAPLPAPAPLPLWQRWSNSLPALSIGIGAAALAGAALLFVTLRPYIAATPSLDISTSEPQRHPPFPAAPAKSEPQQSLPSAFKDTNQAESARQSALQGTGDRGPRRAASGPMGWSSPHERSEGRDSPGLQPRVSPEAIAKPMPTAPLAGRAFLGSASNASIGRGAGIGGPIATRSMAMSSTQGDAAQQSATRFSSAQSLAATPQPTAVNLGSAAAPPPTAKPAAPASAAETVTVESAAALTTESDSLATSLPAATMAKQRSLAPKSPTSLPSKLPTTWLVSSSPRTLAADAAGALFLSLDYGRRWTAVTPQWPGKIAQLRLAPTPPALFELITTTGTVYISPDGLHWQPK
jgi:hypothetical protein